jgi:hypothetical protein
MTNTAEESSLSDMHSSEMKKGKRQKKRVSPWLGQGMRDVLHIFIFCL